MSGKAKTPLRTKKDPVLDDWVRSQEQHQPSPVEQPATVKQVPTYLPPQIPQQYQTEAPPPTKKMNVIHETPKLPVRICAISVGCLLLVLTVLATTMTIAHKHERNTKAKPLHSDTHRYWSNASNLESEPHTGEVYSLFYAFTISDTDEWEQIPAAPGPGILGLFGSLFDDVISIHACCRTKKSVFVCASGNHIDGISFDARLKQSSSGDVYIEVYSLSRMLLGSTCDMEIQLKNS